MTRATRLACAALAGIGGVAALASCASANPYDALVAADGATHYWPLAANSNDTIGTANGTNTGTLNFGQAVSTNQTGFIPGNSSSYTTLPVGIMPLGASLGSSSFVIGFKTGSSLTAAQFLSTNFSSFSSNGNLSVAGSTDHCGSGYVQFTEFDGATHYLCSNAPVSLNTAYHVAVVCTGPIFSPVCSMYVNGTAQTATMTYNSGFDTGPANYQVVGNLDTSASYGATVPIASAAVFAGVALTATQVSHLASCALTNTGCTAPPTDTGGAQVVE